MKLKNFFAFCETKAKNQFDPLLIGFLGIGVFSALLGLAVPAKLPFFIISASAFAILLIVCGMIIRNAVKDLWEHKKASKKL